MTDTESAPGRVRRHAVGRGPVIGSGIVHAAAILLAWWTSAVPPEVPDFIVFEIELISPPAAELGDRTTPPPEELVIERPVDPIPEPQDEPLPTVVEADVPAEEEPPEEVTETQETVAPPDVEVVDDPTPPTSPNPDPDVETPGEELNVRMEGVRRDYPEYYNNIIRQMQRCFRWRGGEDFRATVYFVIGRDGSVSEIDVLESSRSIAFDIEAMGAAECAGRQNRLGPLPEALPFDRLPVLFKFDPRNGRGLDQEE
jgi:outer membrane biosynthesis protein TonB